MTNEPQLLTVYVMLYNERDSLASVVREMVETEPPVPWQVRVVIIDDGSTDGSSDLADELAERYPAVRVLHHAENQGLGGVYRTGFEAAASGWITFLPADGQYRIAETIKLLPAAMDHDLVLSVLEGGRTTVVGRWLSRMERLVMWCLFGRTPPFQGIFLVRAEVVRATSLHSRGRGWGVVLELILRATRAGARWMNVPVQCRPRMAGRSKVSNTRTMWANLKQLFQLRLALFER